MKLIRTITRDYGESFETAYIFNGRYDFDQLRDYFESIGQHFGDSNSGVGRYFQNCSSMAKGSRTIAYINGGLDV